MARDLRLAIRRLLGAAWVGLVACAGDGTTSAPPPQGPTVASVAIDQPPGFLGKIRLDVHDQAPLTATVRDSSGNVIRGYAVTWTSSAPNVASVSSTGMVTAIAAGDATISATSDGKFDSREVQVVALNLTAFQLTVLATDDDGKPVSGAFVREIYYGAAPAGCERCNLPYGGSVSGATNDAGSYLGSFVADPEAMDGFAGGTPHTFAYVTAQKPNYETDRRFVTWALTSFTQPIHLRAMKQIAAGDSLSLTIASTDPVYQDFDTAPPISAFMVCRSVLVHVATDGLLAVTAAPIAAGGADPYVELDSPDEANYFTTGIGTASKAVHAGEDVEVRVVTIVKPGDPAQNFTLRTIVTP